MSGFQAARQKVIRGLRRGNLPALHEESRESIEDLLTINQLGLVTYDSQQGRVVRGNVPNNRALYDELVTESEKELDEMPWLPEGPEYQQRLKRAQAKLEAEYRKRGGKFTRGIVEKERAYLDGIIHKDRAVPLVNWLNQQNNVVAVWFDSVPKSKAETVEKYAPSSIGVTYSLRGQPIDKTGQALTRFTSQPFNVYPPADAVADLDVPITAQQKRELNKDFRRVAIFDARYGHKVTGPDGLFKQLIKGLKLV